MRYHSTLPIISGNGKKIAYISESPYLLPDGKGLVVQDVATGSKVRINMSTDGVLSNAAMPDRPTHISYTGRYVLFRSMATNLIDGETMNPINKYRLYLRDIVGGTTTLVNRNLTTGLVADDGSDSQLTSLGVSSNGRFVAFTSSSVNLVAGVADGSPHLYMLDRQESTLEVIDRRTDGQVGTTNAAWAPKGGMSCDGSIITFQYPSSLIVGETHSGHVDIYVLDRRGDTPKLKNLTSDSSSAALGATISCNGDFIGFHSTAVDLDETISPTHTGYYRPYIYDRVNDKFHFIAINADGSDVSGHVCLSTEEPCLRLSDNGQGVFMSDLASLPGSVGANHTLIYVRDIESTGAVLVSKNLSGDSANAPSSSMSITADGRLVAYMSNASNLIANDTNSKADIFVSRIEY